MRSYVGIDAGRMISTSFTRTGKVVPKVASTARWHMTRRSSADVRSEGLSGRGPHGTIHTSSTLPECTISETHVRCAFVIGSKLPPYTATRILSPGSCHVRLRDNVRGNGLHLSDSATKAASSRKVWGGFSLHQTASVPSV